MSGFQFVASLASSLAWPLVVVVLFAFVWIKREDIGNVFNFRAMPQGRTLRRVRAGPVELEWDQLIESTAEKIAEVPLAATLGPQDGVQQDLKDIARSVPTAAVLEAFARLEKRLREIFDQGVVDYEKVRPLPRRVETMPVMLAVLSRRGVISDEIQESIRNLNRLKNEASHRVGGADITADQASDYLELVDRVLDYLNDISPSDYRR